MKYLKKFNEHSDYNTYISSQDKILPNVSYCVNENEVHYNPWTDPRLIVKYNVVDDSNSTMLYTCISQNNFTINGAIMFDKIELDGVEMSIADLDAAQGTYQLSSGLRTTRGASQSSSGEHTVIYTLKNPTLIGLEIINEGAQQMNVGATFFQCTAITSVTIPDSVTTIGGSTFYQCSGLTNVIIPNNVTSIGDSAFYGCTSLTSVTVPGSVTSIGDGAFQYCGLTSVTIEAITPPTLGDSVFDNNTGEEKIYVPAESVEAYKAASGWSSYASIIEAIS